jgi:S1-C subfamily serine protease
VTGTGFYINAQGHILSNEHVAGDCSSLTIFLPDGTSTTGQVVAADEPNDLAVVLSQARPTASAVFTGSARYRPGDPVVAFGFPLSGTLSDTGNLTTGTISSMAGLGNDSSMVQISAPIQPGNSGGPLLDSSGHVIGVVSSNLPRTRSGLVAQNVNFAIKETVAKAFLQSHRIPFSDGKNTATLSAADIGDLARNYAVRIHCVLK